MSFTRKADYVVEQAKSHFQNAKNWADFSAGIFGHGEGVITTTFPEEAERQMFYDTEQYQTLCLMRQKLMTKFGVNKGGTPEKSGRVLIRLPKSVHKALEIEASKEGVSINQLAVSKLSLPLRERIDLSLPIIAEAFSAVHDGYSVDRVVVDPDYNSRFLAECHRLGLKDSDYRINHALLDIRKSSKIELPKSTKRTEFHDFDEYCFAAEIAVRILQSSKGLTLDQMLCDTITLLEFDKIAKRLVNQPSLKLRWAALNLRKTRKLGPTPVPDKGMTINLITAGPIPVLKPDELPKTKGVYSFFDVTRPLFAGETENLQHRMRLHLEAKMPAWLNMDNDADYVLKYAPLPTTSAKARDLWLQDFINRERPQLNYQKTA
jgi:site-specific DNA-methyltransferase (adenine-specific)